MLKYVAANRVVAAPPILSQIYIKSLKTSRTRKPNPAKRIRRLKIVKIGVDSISEGRLLYTSIFMGQRQ